MSLYERVIGSGENVTKISVHSVRALVGQVIRGSETVNSISILLGLSAEEQSDISRMITAVVASIDPALESQKVFDLLVLGEQGVQGYIDEASFWNVVET